jgi:hypothetical protein
LKKQEGSKSQESIIKIPNIKAETSSYQKGEVKILSLDSNIEKASNGLSNYQHSNNIGSLIFLGEQ